MLQLPDGSKVEVFGSDNPINRHLTTGPVAGFLVDDVQDATAELRSAGVEIVFESGVDDSGNAWVHIRARTATSMSTPRILASPDTLDIAAEGANDRPLARSRSVAPGRAGVRGIRGPPGGLASGGGLGSGCDWATGML